LAGGRVWLVWTAIVASVFAASAQAALPPNDDFANAAVLNGDSGTLTATSTEATVEPDEPFHDGHEGGASVWFTLTAPATGEYVFETCGSQIDTLLAVYTGDALESLDAWASNDDACGPGSRVSLARVFTGTVLKIAVDDAEGLGGPYVLAWRRIDHAPLNTAPPTISGTGTHVEGQTLTGDPGAWTARATITFRYRWERCLASGACTSVGSETTYQLGFRDVGNTIRFVVTARTIDGSATVPSAPTARIGPQPPLNTGPPVITGSPRAGEEIIAVLVGGWQGGELVFRYRWQRCAAGVTACVDMPGETRESLRLTPADVGSVVRLVVTASNSSGTVSAASAPTGVVQPALPKPRACVVPKLRGKTVPAARKALIRSGCRLGRVRRAASARPKGTVSAQTSRPGKRLKPRARVGVVVSLGRKR
jgi:PASTA domain